MFKAYDAGFAPAIDAAGFDPFVIRDGEFLGKICDRIVAEIRRSRFLVADVTGGRLAVAFEAGFAMGLGLPVIWTCREDAGDMISNNFDVRQYNHIVWKDHDDLKERLLRRIQATIPALEDKEARG